MSKHRLEDLLVAIVHQIKRCVISSRHYRVKWKQNCKTPEYAARGEHVLERDHELLQTVYMEEDRF
jgi:hypothetical protein